MTPLEQAKQELQRRKNVEAARAELERRRAQRPNAREVAQQAREQGAQPSVASQQMTDMAAADAEAAQDRAMLDQLPGALNASTRFTTSLPFVGPYMDEAADVLSPGSGDELKARSDAFERENPRTSMVVDVASGLTGFAVPAGPAAQFIGRGGNVFAQAARAGGLGAAAGATEGAISGFGRGETPEERKQLFKEDAMIGGAVGGALGIALPALGSLTAASMRRIRGLDIAEIASVLGISPKAARIIKGYLANEDLDAAQKRLAELGDDAFLADAGPATQQALDTAASSGGEALVTARSAVDARANSLTPRLTAALDETLGQPSGLRSANTEIAQRTADRRQKAFDAAFSSPIDYASEAGREIETVVQRIPPRTLKSAIEEANEAMIEGGRQNLQIMASIADDGSISLSQPMNVEQLHFVKQALADIAEQGRNSLTGRMTQRGDRARRLAGDLRNALKKAVPSYNAAMRLGGDKIAQQDGLRLGYDIFKPSTTFEVVRDAVRGASDETKAAMRQGMRQRVDELLDGVKRSISSPDMETQQAMRLLRELSSDGIRKKLRLVMPTADAQKLVTELDRATTALELRAAIATNSKTAIRDAGRQTVQETYGRTATEEVMSSPMSAPGVVLRQTIGVTDGQVAARTNEGMAEIARALTQTRGRDAQRALAMVRRAMDGQQLKDAEIEFINRVAGDLFASSGYQLGTQTLEQTSQSTP